MISFVCLSVGP